MYLDHFGLRESPFRITPHTEFFFSGANRGATLEALIYAITHDEGIVKVSGEVGSGKTMLCRMLLERLPENVDTVYLANPSLSRDEILYAIAEELSAPLPEARAHLLLHSLQERLIEIYAADRQVVVMIDEAHAMPPETLEEIRLLSNLETNRHKLLHIVLFGQPELDDRLSSMSMRQLKERITHNFALEPLRRSDTGKYLMFRMRAAGYRGPDLFTPVAIQLISRASEGLTRRINILADKALLSAFSESKHQIDRRQVRAAIRDAQFNPMHESHWFAFRPKMWMIGATLLTLIAAIAFVAGSYTSSREATVVASKPAETALNPPSAQSAPALPETPAPTVSAPPVVKPPVSSDLLAGLEERIAATEEWLKITPDTHYFIQLFSTDGRNTLAVEQFLERTKGLDPQQIHVYRSKLSGRDKVGVIYGDYPSLELANAALAELNKTRSVNGPYIRHINKLK
ncbi:MAG: AAA family ATPase [Betaproteobacteria bacterium]